MPTDEPDKNSRLGITARVLYNETLLIAATLLVSLGTVVALAMFLRFDDKGLSLFRVLIITIFTILPAVMYYVFIASRKQSLYQEFVSNLSRLGLLQGHEHNAVQLDIDENSYFRRTRILSYIDRFEAVYGPIGIQQKSDLLEATVCSDPSIPVLAATENNRGRIFSPATAVPVFIATFLIGLGWIQFIPPWDVDVLAKNTGNVTLHSALIYNELPSLFAFAGAYFFSLQMLYRRYVTNDLRASAFISVSIRIVLAVIGAWLLQVVFSMDVVEIDNETYWLLFTAFVVGVFPPVLWRILRNVSSRLLIVGKILPALDSDLPMNALSGLTIWHQTRLEEEDIENGYNMANADIISLLVNTKMPPERIIDWVDQAILYTSTGQPERDVQQQNSSLATRLAQLGIGNASTLKRTVNAKFNDMPLNSPHFVDLQSVEMSTLVERVNGFSNLALIEHWRTQLPYIASSNEEKIKKPDQKKLEVLPQTE